MKRTKILWLTLSAVLFLLLAGCNANNADTAVRYLEALNQRDLQTAENLVCPARQDDVAMGLTTVSDPQGEQFNFENISCQPQGDGVACRFSIQQTTQDAPLTGTENARQVVFNFEDGKVCGFEEQVAQ